MNFQKITLVMLLLAALGSANAQENGGGPTEATALPITNGPSIGNYFKQPTIAQQRAMFEADQRTTRLEWYRWIGHSPARPNYSAGHMSYSSQSYFVSDRGLLINSNQRSWFW